MKTYRSFLIGLLDELVEAIRICETREFHHFTGDTEEWKVYNRLCGWANEIHERLQFYAKTKRTKFQYVAEAAPAAPSLLGGYADFERYGERGPGYDGLAGDSESVR